MPYDVQTPVYEGPFDLLLHLILREQVDLYEVSLSRIVDAYITELEKLDDLDLEVATEFLLIAATLVELKTKRSAARRTTTSTSTTSSPSGKSATCCWHGCSTARRSRTRRRCWPPWPTKRRTPIRALLGLEDQFLDLAPDLLEGVTAPQMHAAFLRATAPKPVPTVGVAHLAEIRASVTDAVEELIDELPQCRALRRSASSRRHSWTASTSSCDSSQCSSSTSKASSTSSKPSSFGAIQVVSTAGPQPACVGPRRHRLLRRLMADESTTQPSRPSDGGRPTDRGPPARAGHRAPVDHMEALLREMAVEFFETRGFVLVEVAGGWRFQTIPTRGERRTVRARRPIGAAVGCRPRDPRDRRLQATDLTHAHSRFGG